MKRNVRGAKCTFGMMREGTLISDYQTFRRDSEVAPTEKRSVQQTITVESLNERVFIRIGIILIIHHNKDFQVISILTK